MDIDSVDIVMKRTIGFSMVEYIVFVSAVILGLVAVMSLFQSALKKKQYDSISSLFGPGFSTNATYTSW